MSDRVAYAKIENGVFCRVSDDIELANGSVAPVQCYYDVDDSEYKARYVDFAVQVNCDPNTSDTLPIVTVDLHDGILRPIEQQQPLLRIYKTADRKHLEADILEDICATGKSTCPYFTRYGPVCLNGEQWVYVCGDEVIGLPPGVNYRITSDVAAKHLVYDPTLDPQDAVERFDRLLRGKGSKNQAIISTAYWPLWLFTLVTAFRSVIEDESTTTYFALLLCGKHGTRKTSAARMLTLLFDVEPNLGAFPVEFNASSGFKAIAAAITGVPDQTILVDDATIAGADTKEARLREETAQQLVRLCVNTSEQAVLTSHTTATTRRFQGGLVMTGESLLSGASTNDRIINVMVENSLTTTSKEGRTLAATAFRLFIAWCLPRLPALLKDLHMHRAAQWSEDNLRLEQVAELLLWMVDIWYNFVAEVTKLSDAKKTKRIAEAGIIVSCLIDQQAELVDRIDQPQPEGNLLYYLRNCYKAHEFKVANDKDDWNPKESALIKKDIFLVKPEYLLSVITDKTPLQFPTEKAIGKELDRLKLLTTQEADKHTVKRHGERVYCIDLNQLIE